MKPTLLIAMLVALCFQASADIIYVQKDATGDGTSWSNSFGDLQAALAAAEPGDQIWVAEGVYTPSGDDRNAFFSIPDNVQLYGGFEGEETSLEERNLTENPTILSGEIGEPGYEDNSFTILYLDKVSENTLIDGFIITAGNANGELEDSELSRCGGGLYINGFEGSAKPVIANCEFKANRGRDGAAVYNNGRQGESSPVFINCRFTLNEAGLDGGAIYNDGRIGGKSIPTLTNCEFERNMGTYGGAICNANEMGVCNLILNNCVFKENAAYLRGGAVFSLNGDEKCYLEMLDCQFVGNYPDDQNMIFTSNTSRSAAYKISRSEP